MSVNILSKIDLNNSCRLCITGKLVLRDIHQTKISKIIESCVLIKISEDDGLPSKICSMCFHTIIKLHTFKEKAECNDKILRTFLHKKNNVNVDANIDVVLNEENLCPKIDNNCNNDNVTLKIEEQKSKTFEIDAIPPLIPITHEKLKTVENVFRDLPKDAPPLVPLKPLADIKTLETVVPELEYKCYSCNEKFKNVSLLKQHTLASCKPKDLQCTICLKAFNERKRLIGHLKGHMVIKQHACTICDKKYPNPSTLEVHVRSHTGEKPFKCHICGKGFVRWSGVNIHMKTHEDKRPFMCDICNKTFKIHSNMERHKRIHFGTKPYSCLHCYKKYSQLENLTLHTRTCHTNDRPYLCNICGKGYVNSTRLNRHMWIHAGRKPYRCRNCPKVYSNSANLRIHEYYHMGKNINEIKKYPCKICNMRFFHPSRLARHNKVHEKEVKCHECGTMFVDKKSYKVHLKESHGLKEHSEDSLQS